MALVISKYTVYETLWRNKWRMCPGYMWLRIEPSGGLLLIRHWTFRFSKRTSLQGDSYSSHHWALNMTHHSFRNTSLYLRKNELISVWFVRFQVPTAASMKFRVFWDVAPCCVVGVDRRFRGAYCLHHQGDDGPDDGSSTHLWNVDLLRDYTELHPRRL
jgi:hypothetical protein